MTDRYAEDYTEIPMVLTQHSGLRDEILALIRDQPMPGKVTEGEHRLEEFRDILADLVNGQIDLPRAIWRTEAELPQQASPHRENNRVFPASWAERLVRTQYSRFYNQAVMEQLLARGETECFVPHSAIEESTSPCSQQLAGRNHDLEVLHERLIESYANGKWSQQVKIPNHPYCTHVVAPARP
jgi:hypothetical protein